MNIMNRRHQWLCLMTLVAVLTACRQKPKDRLYEAFKCSAAAALLEHEDEAAKAGAKVEAELAKPADSKSRLAVVITELNARFHKEFPESKQVQEIYASDTCQAMYSPQLLNLGGTSSGAPATSGTDKSGLESSARPGETTPAAVLKIGRDYVADAQGAFTVGSVVAYCRAFSDVLFQPQDVQDCLRLVQVDPEWRRDMPATPDKASLLQSAASLPLLRRFGLCTSDQALRLVQSFEDYNACMPLDLGKALDKALSDEMSKAQEAAGVGPPASPYNDPLSTASGLSQEERIAYCRIPAVAEQLDDRDKEVCVKRTNDAATTNMAHSGAQETPIVDPRAVLSNASRMRSQAERSAFCNRPDVSAALTTQQRQECEVGLSPNDPPANVLTDDDPGYRDEE